MTKKEVANLYNWLQGAKVTKLTDEEKIKFIRMMRTLKPVAKEVRDATNDALETAKDERYDEMVKRINEGATSANQIADAQSYIKHICEVADKAVSDLLAQDVQTVLPRLSEETFERLCLSNDWNMAQVADLEQYLLDVNS